MGTLLVAAVALMLILEGSFPLFSPSLWRTIFLRIASMKDGQIRYFGFSCVLGGIVLLFLLFIWN
jgi:uncharacterized protein YjeT (DUF2065 family)